MKVLHGHGHGRRDCMTGKYVEISDVSLPVKANGAMILT
jgi:hypothetical protein